MHVQSQFYSLNLLFYHVLIAVAIMVKADFSLRIVVVGEQFKITGELLWKSKALSGNEQNLAGEFRVVDGQFSDLQCLMNTL